MLNSCLVFCASIFPIYCRISSDLWVGFKVIYAPREGLFFNFFFANIACRFWGANLIDFWHWIIKSVKFNFHLLKPNEPKIFTGFLFRKKYTGNYVWDWFVFLSIKTQNWQENLAALYCSLELACSDILANNSKKE